MTRTTTLITSLVLFSAVCWSACYARDVQSEVIRPTWEDYVAGLEALLEDPHFREELARHEQEYRDMLEGEEADPDEVEFPCIYDHYASTPARFTRPQSVDELTASDIELVGALGDSITAGNGINAKTLVGVRTQYRGYSWSIGGEVDYTDGSTTVPNILKYFNPDVTGFSLHSGKAEEYTAARLNQAVPGSIARDLPDQANAMVALLKERQEADKHWKLITLFVGGNDLCRYCNNPEVLSAKNYANYIKTALDILEKNLNNTFINVAAMFDITPLGTMKKGFTCKQVDDLLCPCGTNPDDMPAVAAAVVDYNREVARMLEQSPHLTARQDFTVVYQPFMRDNDIPRKPSGHADLGFFAPDCFHFSRKGHNTVAKFLWNAMFEPVGSKNTTTPYDIRLHCPPKDEFFKTHRNSVPGWTPKPKADHHEVHPDMVDDGYFRYPADMTSWRMSLFYVTAGCVGVVLVGLMLTIIIILTRRPHYPPAYGYSDKQPLM